MPYLVWFFAGCVIAIPYNYLAGGNFGDFLATAFIAPAAVISLIIAYNIRTIDRRGFCKYGKWRSGFFWAVVVWFLSPVLLRGVSFLIELGGYERVGHYVFELRYLSLVAVPVLLVAYGWIVEGVMNLRERFRGSKTPPSNIPPSDGFGANKIAALLSKEETKTEGRDTPGTLQIASI